jgi:hypothetical protein
MNVVEQAVEALEIDPKRRLAWVVVWVWDDGVVWPLHYSLRTMRRDSIAAFEGRNHQDYRKLRRQGKAKAIRVSLEPRP